MFPLLQFWKVQKIFITLPHILRSRFVCFTPCIQCQCFINNTKQKNNFSLRSCTRSIDDKVWKTESISTSIDEFGNRKNTCEVTAIELLSTKVLLNNSVIFLLNKATKKNVEIKKTKRRFQVRKVVGLSISPWVIYLSILSSDTKEQTWPEMIPTQTPRISEGLVVRFPKFV